MWPAWWCSTTTSSRRKRQIRSLSLHVHDFIDSVGDFGLQCSQCLFLRLQIKQSLHICLSLPHSFLMCDELMEHNYLIRDKLKGWINQLEAEITESVAPLQVAHLYAFSRIAEHFGGVGGFSG